MATKTRRPQVTRVITLEKDGITICRELLDREYSAELNGRPLIGRWNLEVEAYAAAKEARR